MAYGCPGWNDPYDVSSQSLDYFFTTYVTSGNYTQGAWHQRALLDMYTYGLWNNLRYEIAYRTGPHDNDISSSQISPATG